MTKHFLFFGFGYVAQALYAQLKQEGGWTFSATARRAEKAQWLKQLGIEAYPIDEAPLHQASHFLVSIPPEQGKGDLILSAYNSEWRDLTATRWAGYLSSTGVYGDHGGKWVTEETPPAPTNARARRRYQAESGWHALHRDYDLPLHIFRLGGIYGPGRNMLTRIARGDHVPVISDKTPYSNRIHIADIVQALLASIHEDADPLGEIYNLVDDTPAPTPEVVKYCHDLLGLKHPAPLTLAKSGLSAMGKSFYREDRRVSNQLIKDRFNLKWNYPDYKSGFESLLSEVKAQKAG